MSTSKELFNKALAEIVKCGIDETFAARFLRKTTDPLAEIENNPISALLDEWETINLKKFETVEHLHDLCLALKQLHFSEAVVDQISALTDDFKTLGHRTTKEWGEKIMRGRYDKATQA